MTPSLESPTSTDHGPEQAYLLPALHAAAGVSHWPVFSSHLAQGGSSLPATLAQLQGTERTEAVSTGALTGHMRPVRELGGRREERLQTEL